MKKINKVHSMRNTIIKEKKGITLIALIVTIIVIFILAGITISMITSNNGILNKVGDAKSITGEKQILEELKIAIKGLAIDYHSNNQTQTFRDYIFTEEGQQKINNSLTEDATFNDSNYTITYKEITFDVNEAGNISKKEAIVVEEDESGIIVTATVTPTESRAALIQLTATMENEEPPSPETFDSYDEETKINMFMVGYNSLFPDAEWGMLVDRYWTEYPEEVFEYENEEQQRTSSEVWGNYENLYDFIIQTKGYEEPFTFEMTGEETKHGTRVEYAVTKNGTYSISISKNEASKVENVIVNDCKIEEYSSICLTTTKLKVSANGTLVPIESELDTVVATVPAGFAYGKSTNVGSVETGLVITDHVEEVSVSGTSKNYSDGNEFVWIPATHDSENCEIIVAGKAMARYDDINVETNKFVNPRGVLWDIENDNNEELLYCKEPAYVNSSYENTSVEGVDIYEEFENMMKSVITYGGFYISRYEMGVQEIGDNIKPISKIAVTPNTAYDLETSQWYGLFRVARQYTNQNVNKVVSQMIWGCQYDAMLNYALEHGNDSYKVNSIDYGQNQQKLLKTGLTKNTTIGNAEPTGDSILNIFDLAGNLQEWTQEKYGGGKNANRIMRRRRVFLSTLSIF